MAAQTPKIEAGQVLLPAEAHWKADFLDELLSFPNGGPDDQVDSVSQFLAWTSTRWDDDDYYDGAIGGSYCFSGDPENPDAPPQWQPLLGAAALGPFSDNEKS